MNRENNYIIVGQGLAGSILALTLLKQGKRVAVIDNGHASASSRVAAGLFNPVVFKRLVKSWLADDLLPCMDTFYPEMEELLGTKFYFPKRILKPFAEEQERILWLKKTEEPVGRYLSKIIHNDDLDGIVVNPLGMSEVLHAGSLDTTVFLDSCKAYLKKESLFREEEFDHNKMLLNERGVTYKDFSAKKIIFCEGFKAIENPYFSWLPFKLTKGETLIIKLSEAHKIPLEIVINKAVFILPLGNNSYKVGATYEWEDLSPTITEKGRQALIEKLEKILKVPFEIIGHEAGIRPTVKTRRPLIGLHPDHPQLAVFNGLGTKGVMLAPYFARQFADALDGKGRLDKEVDIAHLR